MLDNDLLFASLEYLPYKTAVQILMVYDMTLVEKLPLRNFKIESHNPTHKLYHLLTDKKNNKKLKKVSWSTLPTPEELSRCEDIEELSFSHSFKGRDIHTLKFPPNIHTLSFGNEFEYCNLLPNLISFNNNDKHSSQDIQWPESLTHLSFSLNPNRYHIFFRLVYKHYKKNHQLSEDDLELFDELASICTQYPTHKLRTFYDKMTQLSLCDKTIVKLPNSVTHLKMSLTMFSLFFINFPENLQVLYVTNPSLSYLGDNIKELLSFSPFFQTFVFSKAAHGYRFTRLKTEPRNELLDCDGCYICGEHIDKTVTLGCNHRIHLGCYLKWKNSQTEKDLCVSCPYCRKKVEKK